jgi:peptide/nickel transport system substrate-binding protein
LVDHGSRLRIHERHLFEERAAGCQQLGALQRSTADALCNKASLEFDIGKQDQAIAELHQYVVDQAMWIWVVHDLNPRALAPKVKGFVPPQAWYVDLSALDIV